MTTTTEPRALTAALSSPAFVTRSGGLAMHVANRHVMRWAPEVGEPGANRIRPLRNLGFVDRLVTPWVESAQRSSSLRMFSQYVTGGAGERQPSPVSWVFPRPWYQDELDWMAAARVVGTQAQIQQAQAPQMLTTRGTYVAPTSAAAQLALPAALHEYVAPSLSVARPDAPHVSDAYSPLVPLAATQAAHVMARAVEPILGGAQTPNAAAARMSPNLRAVLTTLLERSAQPADEPMASRVSMLAPELVTPPAPRPAVTPSAEAVQATQVAEQIAEQRARVAELQRVARIAAEREYAARLESARTARATPDARIAEVRAAEARAIEQRQAELQQRARELAAQRGAQDAARRDAERTAAEAERRRIEERIAQRIAERTASHHEAQRLHAQAREAAARDARVPPAPAGGERAASEAAVQAEARVQSEVAAAIAALPPELANMVASGIGSRPDRAAQAIAELGEALRTVELIARTTAAGGTIEPTRGPRLVMPAGLGGLVATVDRTIGERARPRVPAPAIAQPTPRRELRVPAMTFLEAARVPASGAVAPAPTSALGAATTTTPAALQHVAWSDRWLARFAGATSQSLDLLTATSAAPELRLEMLAAAAPGTVFVAPSFDRARDAAASSQDVLPTLRNAAPAQPVARFDDDAETPDDVFAAIAAAATQSRGVPAASAPSPAQEERVAERETLADLVAHAAPSAPGAGLSAQLASSPFAPALRHVLPLAAAPAFDVRSLFGGGLGATYLAGLLSAPSDEITISAPAMPAWASWTDAAFAADAGELPVRDVVEFEPTYVAPEAPAVEDAALAEQARALATPLTTVRSALLSWDGEATAADTGAPETRVSPAATPTPLARSMVDALTLPMLGEAAALRELGALDLAGMTAHASYAAPGMIADRAQAWSVAQERSSADLALDFVTPELVLAARVYGLGPAEAAQAARLAIAGPGQLTAMASAVDRTFVQALAIESDRRGERGRALTTAFPLTTATPAAAADAGGAAASAPTSTGAAFGVDRRAVRGAFLWPAATTAALGLTAAAPDGELSMSVAALELLAAQAVAELGTYAALGDRELVGEAGGIQGGPALARTVESSAAEAGEADVLASASALVPAARREKFQALYVALGQSPSGRTWSPAARAARALALAGRGDETITARERASVAWDVLPLVYAGDEGGESLSTGDAALRATRRREELRALEGGADMVLVDGRPGLGALSARAGEALGSYVSPSAAASPTPSSSVRGEVGAVLRAPTAAQELVQTGRPAGRHGGGEVEIPPWFEAAARKMLEERSSVSDGISLAELTLVQTAAPQQIAAASRDGGSTAPVAPAPSAAAGAEKEKIDIEKLANDVYREILVLMDIARARNGEPYL